MKPKINHGAQLFILALMFLGSLEVSGQVIANLTVQPAPNQVIGATEPWDKICAGNNGGFNQYFATVTFDGGSNPGNEWILELSDASGDFSNPVELARETSDTVVENPGFEFSIPTDTRGAGYKLRARSTDPVAMAETAAGYSMYYMDFVTNLIITSDGSGSPQGTICSANTITLGVDNVTNPSTYQYRWYRDLTLLTGETGPTLTVGQSGMYFAQIDYGDCSDNGTTDSNIVDVTIGATGSGTTINPPSKTALCAGDTETLTVSTSASSPTYQWYKDGVAITPNGTSATYTVDANVPGFEGDYQVEVTETGACADRSPAVTFTNADDFTVTRVNAANLVLLPGDSETLSVTTTAVSPDFQWFQDGNPVGTNSSSYDATQAGTYYVEVTQQGGTCPGTVKNSETTQVVIPTSFELIVDYGTSYTACESTDVVLEVDIINAVLSDGSRIDVTSDVQSNFTYQWKKDGLNVSGATSNSISLTDISENGDYEVDGALSTYNSTSNQLSVQLLTAETLTINSTSTVYCNSSDTITLSTATDLTGESFEWRQDGTSINTTDNSFDVNQPGTYRLVIDRNGCDLMSNEITISPLDPDLITIDPDGVVVFPEGTTRTVTASGGTAYRWYNANSVEMSNTASVTFDTEGTYILIANIDNCEITRQVTVEYLDTFKVPNVITPNGDGFNDQWVLPNSYSNKPDVTVIVYRESGEELMNVQNYRNDWPDASLAFPQQNMVFYYTIKNANETLKQGTITVIR